MSVEEKHILQIHADVVKTAQALLNETMLGDGRVHPKAHPDLLEHSGWIQAKKLLNLALLNFESTARLPARSNSTVTWPRQKRSFLGLSTVSDTARLEEHIKVLQATEEKAIKMTNFLRGKLLRGAKLMKEYIHAGESRQKQTSRTLLHVQLEVTFLLLLRAAEDATRELNALSESIIKGRLSSAILSQFHYGDLIAISSKDNGVPILTFAVSLLKPMKFNCTQIKTDFLCSLPGNDFVTTSKFGFDQPAVTHASAFYAKISDAMNANPTNDFPSCLEKNVGVNLKWHYFCWGSKGRKGHRMEPSILSLSLHASEPEKVLVDLEDLQVPATTDLAESTGLLDFESTAYLGTDNLSSPYSPSWLFV